MKNPIIIIDDTYTICDSIKQALDIFEYQKDNNSSRTFGSPNVMLIFPNGEIMNSRVDSSADPSVRLPPSHRCDEVA